MRSVHSFAGFNRVAIFSISCDSSRSLSTCTGRGGAPSAILGTDPVAAPYGGGAALASAGGMPPLFALRSIPPVVDGLELPAPGRDDAGGGAP